MSTTSEPQKVISESRYLATCPKGVENILAKELRALGANDVTESVAGCYFNADLAQAYKICINSRVVNRVVLLLAREYVNSTEELHDLCAGLGWSNWFDANKTLAVDFNGTSEYIRDQRFGTQLVKDAINDHFKALSFPRLVVDPEYPDVLVYVRLFKNRISIGIDMVGESLHKRGYRQSGGKAPLKENLAAAILLLADWPAKAAAGEPFIDPMCGSATLLIEAALIAHSIPPSFLRKRWLFKNLSNYDSAIWDEACKAVDAEREANTYNAQLQGFDIDSRALDVAWQNISEAGLCDAISLQQAPVDKALNTVQEGGGLVAVNPPYGVRLGDIDKLQDLYQDLGRFLKTQCLGWDAAVFTGNHDLGWSTGLRSWRQHKLFNGAIACQLQRYRIEDKNFIEGRLPQEEIVSERSLSHNAQMLANRLKKNQRKLKNWLKANSDICFRLYDADLPEYAVAIDGYYGYIEGQNTADKQMYFHVQEYVAPASIDAALAKRRIKEVVMALSAVYGCEQKRIVVKRRERQKGAKQYEKRNDDAPNLIVSENGHRFQVNLERYLDTGLFLDHRLVRSHIASNVAGKRFLNLFAYTSAASIYAARAGAASSTSVDMSQTYINWSADNFSLNHIDPRKHQLVRADCLVWLADNDQTFDCILLDPPSFSNSKKMTETLDIQRDHEKLIELAMLRLDPQGGLYFSTNKRGFKLASTVSEKYRVEMLTHKTLDVDFNRPRPAHQCWLISHQ